MLSRRRLACLATVARKYAHKIPFIVKINHNELLTYPNKFDQVMFGTVDRPTTWRGRRRRDNLFWLRESTRQITEVAKAFA